MVAEPRRTVEEQLGIEDFNFPGTYRLLGLPPERPDLLHCHNLHGYGGYFDLRALPWLSRKLPLILNLRDAWLLSGHCAHAIDCERWRIGCGKCPDLDLFPPVRRDGTAYNWRRKKDIFERSRLYITTPSRWLMDKVRTSMLSGVHYRVIPNAIDLTVFHPVDQNEARRQLDLPSDAKIVLLIAQNMFKDYRVMEEALGRLDDKDCSSLLFICLGKDGEGKKVGRGKMLFPGFERDPSRMAQYYSAADVFIHAAKAEAFGKAVTEAMACGTPVVATATGGIPEQLEDGQMGFLVPVGDSYAMTSAIERLLADEELSLSMGQTGAKNAEQRFGLDRQVGAFLDWYRELLEDWRSMQLHAMSNTG